MDIQSQKTILGWAILALLLGSVGLSGCTASVDVGDEAEVEAADSTGTLPASIPGSAPANAEPGPLDTVLKPYESVRQALVEDQLEGVAEAAASIRDAGKAFMEEPHDGMPAEELSALESLIPALISAAGDLAQAGDVAVARASFWALSESLLKYRSLYASQDLRVAYCPMADKSWLQPDGEIGNPFYGQAMANCGSFVDEESGSSENT